MADCKYAPREFIQKAFAPLVAVFTSPAVNKVCEKNNFTFVELLKPFCTINKEANFRDPSGNIITINNFHINIADINHKPPEAVIARRLLNQSVSQEMCEEMINVQANSVNLEIPATVPWFDNWRDTFLQVQFPSDHEYTKHYIACVIVTSTTDEDPIDTLSNMVQQLQQMLGLSPVKLMPKWFSSSILRYYVLLHDLSAEDVSKAKNVYDEMKLTYSPQCCHMLQINSNFNGKNNAVFDYWSPYLKEERYINQENYDTSSLNSFDSKEDAYITSNVLKNNSADVVIHPLSPLLETRNIVNDSQVANNYYYVNEETGNKKYGEYLTEGDVQCLRIMISSFFTDALLPFIETQVQYLNEMVTNKKGVSKSLFSATKRWFGTNKPGSPVNADNSYSYSSDCPEIQMRRLADLCFMFCAYTYAFQAYHTAKRDFNADAAWLHYAGALEMAALSAFLVGLDIKKAQEYTDESITTYLHTCRMPQFATRVTLCVSELLKELRLYGEAAKFLIQMTSEESDLRSALLLEQAAYCFIKSKKPCMPRKYAFHLVLAGHRYSKAGQKKHSLRCYRQAFQVYEGKNWSLAEDHIHFTIGRLAASLKEIDVPVQEFSKLFTRSSRQLQVQQTTFLKEYILALNEMQIRNENEELPRLEIPKINNSSIKVMLDSIDDSNAPTGFVPASGLILGQEDDSPNSRWSKLEEKLVSYANNNSLPIMFKPTISLLSDFTNNSSKQFTSVGESINLSVDLVNVLNIPVSLKNIRLMWNYSSITSERDLLAQTHCIPLLILNPDSSTQVLLNIVPLALGEIQITGISYSIVLASSTGEGSISVVGYQKLEPRGMKISKINKNKQRNILNSNIPNDSLYLPDYRLEFNVIDSAPCLRVYFEDLPSEIFCGELYEVKIHLHNVGILPISRVLLASTMPDLLSVPYCDYNKNAVYLLPLTNPIRPGDTNLVTIYMRGHDIAGHVSIDLLFYYNADNSSHDYKPESSHNNISRQKIVDYRLVYHSSHLFVRESIYAICNTNRTFTANEENHSEIINILLQIKNINPVTSASHSNILLQRISMFSKNWILFDFVQPLDDGITILENMETSFLLLKARRKMNPNNNWEFSSINLSQNDDDQLELNKMPYYDFMKAKAEYSLRPERSSSKQNSSLNLESALEINSLLNIVWKAEVKRNKTFYPITGQHHIALIQLGEKYQTSGKTEDMPVIASTPTLKIFEPQAVVSESLTSDLMFSSLNINKQLVFIRLKHEQYVTHSFSEQRIFCLPIYLILQNCSDYDLEVKIDTLQKSNANSIGKNTVLHQPVCSNFWWLGIIQRIIVLARHSTSTIQMTGCFGTAGAYDLASSFTISARISNFNEQCFVVQSSKPVSYIFISNKFGALILKLLTLVD